MAGVVLIVIAAVAFFATAYTLSSVVSRMRVITLGPGDRVMVSAVNPGGLLVVVYMDSMGNHWRFTRQFPGFSSQALTQACTQRHALY